MISFAIQPPNLHFLGQLLARQALKSRSIPGPSGFKSVHLNQFAWPLKLQIWLPQPFFDPLTWSQCALPQPIPLWPLRLYICDPQWAAARSQLLGLSWTT